MDYYEKCCQYQNIDYRYLIIIYIHTISNTSSFEINWIFFGGGPKLSPLAVTKLFSRAFQQHISIWVWEMQSTGKCLKSNKVFTTQCLANK